MSEVKYTKSRVAVDAAIFTIEKGILKIFLTKREKEPFKGRMELLGGLLYPQETADETLNRKLKGIATNHDIFFTQFQAFTAPDRDPRERTVSIGYVALVNPDSLHSLKDFHDIDSLPELAFDHKTIIEHARSFLKDSLSTDILKRFMPDEFPLNSLQETYELLKQETQDNRNFRKKMIGAGIVRDTGHLETNVSHRPAKLFRFA